MNPIHIEFREAVIIVIALISGYLYLARTLASQFKRSNDEQLTALKEAITDGDKRSDANINQLRETMTALDRDVRRIERELPQAYVSKDDYVTRVATLDSKIDNVNSQQAHIITLLKLRLGSNGNG